MIFRKKVISILLILLLIVFLALVFLPKRIIKKDVSITSAGIIFSDHEFISADKELLDELNNVIKDEYCINSLKQRYFFSDENTITMHIALSNHKFILVTLNDGRIFIDRVPKKLLAICTNEMLYAKIQEIFK